MAVLLIPRLSYTFEARSEQRSRIRVGDQLQSEAPKSSQASPCRLLERVWRAGTERKSAPRLLWLDQAVGSKRTHLYGCEGEGGPQASAPKRAVRPSNSVVEPSTQAPWQSCLGVRCVGSLAAEGVRLVAFSDPSLRDVSCRDRGQTSLTDRPWPAIGRALLCVLRGLGRVSPIMYSHVRDVVSSKTRAQVPSPACTLPGSSRVPTLHCCKEASRCRGERPWDHRARLRASVRRLASRHIFQDHPHEHSIPFSKRRRLPRVARGGLTHRTLCRIPPRRTETGRRDWRRPVRVFVGRSMRERVQLNEAAGLLGKV